MKRFAARHTINAILVSRDLAALDELPRLVKAGAMYMCPNEAEEVFRRAHE